MPRAVSNRPARATGPYERTPAGSEPARAAADDVTGGRRESGFRALSRRISQVFSLAAGRPSEEQSKKVADSPSQIEAAEPSENSRLLDDTSIESRHSLASRAPSASRKASVNLSLLRTQRDMRLPAHMIVDAYREALRERAESAAAPKRRAPSPPPAKDDEPRAKSARVERRSIAAADSPRRASVRRPKPIKHKIQLVTKPVLDLSALSEDRKKRPGFISANFDVSDDESESENPPTTQTEPAASLVRRPQVASDKLQRALAEPPAPEPSTRPPAESAASPAEGDKKPAAGGALFGGLSGLKSNGLQNSGLQSANAQSAQDTPKFSFDAVATENAPAKAAPKFSFGAASSESASAPSFSFGASKPPSAGAQPGTDAAPTLSEQAKPAQEPSKPLFSFGDSTSKPGAAPLFGASDKNALQKQDDKNASADKPAQAPAFSFGLAKGDDKSNEKPLGQPSFNFTAKGSETNSSNNNSSATSGSGLFGSLGGGETKAPNTDSNNSAPAESSKKPLFSFGNTGGGGSSETPKPTFSFSAGGDQGPKKPTFQFGASNNSASTSQQPTAAAPLFGGNSTTNPPTDKQESGQNGGTKPVSFNFGAPAQPQANGSSQATKPLTFGNFGNTADGGTKDGKSGATPGSSAADTKSNDGPNPAFGAPSVKQPAALPAPPSATNSAGATPTFEFGSNGGSDSALKPAFGQAAPAFGASKPSSPALFGAGNAGTGAPGFNFKPSTPTPGSTTPGAGAGTPQPSFNFGGTSWQPAAQPAAQTTAPQQPAPFGQVAPAGQPPQQLQQPFQFGAAAANNNRASTPFSMTPAAGANRDSPSGFTFGAPAAAAGPSQFASRETTPGAAAPTQQRKIAQVKKRLQKPR